MIYKVFHFVDWDVEITFGEEDIKEINKTCRENEARLTRLVIPWGFSWLPDVVTGIN